MPGGSLSAVQEALCGQFVWRRWPRLGVVVAVAAARTGSSSGATAVEHNGVVPSGAIVIGALGHASVQIEQGGKVVIVDPVSGQADLSKAKRADLLLVTDIHPDHFDPAAIAKLRKPGAPVVVPPAVAETQKIPDVVVMRNREMRTNESALAGLTIISRAAYNLQRGPAPGQLIIRKGAGRDT